MINQIKERLTEIEEKHGENFADAISYAIDIFNGEDDTKTLNDFFLAVLFDMPLPESGAADHLIKFLQERDVERDA